MILTTWECSTKSVSHTIQGCNGRSPRGWLLRLFNNFPRFTHDSIIRDVVHWPGASRFEATQEKQLPNHLPDADNLRQRLTSNLRTFCPSINCLHSVCETHGMLTIIVGSFTSEILLKRQVSC